MQNDNLKVKPPSDCFIWGFTAILGALITITADALVWYRMFFCRCLLALFWCLRKNRFNSLKVVP
jgi:hypothetical protein